MTTTIHIPETGQTVAVTVAAIGEGRVRVTIDGELRTHALQDLHRTSQTHPESHVRRVWSEIVQMGVRAEADEADAAERDRERRVRACGGHRAISSTHECYSGPVGAGDDQNPAAHGCVTIVEQCACGADRHTNVNGRHVEEGAWH